jgi:hypothetical protein
MRLVFGVILWAACAPKPKDQRANESHQAQQEPSPPAQLTPWEYHNPETPGQFDQSKAEAAIGAALVRLRTVGGAAPLAAYGLVMEHADEGCPYFSEYEGSVYWYGGCTTHDGVRFEGYSFFDTYEDTPAWGEDSSMSGPTLNSQSFVILEDGDRFDMGGSAYAIEGWTADDGLYAWSTGVSGAFGWSPHADDPTWMGTDLRPDIETVALLWDFGDGSQYKALMSTAAMAALPTQWSTVFVSELFSVDEISGYWPCPGEPSGTISVRSESGHWFEIVYDVKADGDDWTIAPDSCDGCGTAYLDGMNVGQACNDFSVLTDWEDAPW